MSRLENIIKKWKAGEKGSPAPKAGHPERSEGSPSVMQPSALPKGILRLTSFPQDDGVSTGVKRLDAILENRYQLRRQQVRSEDTQLSLIREESRLNRLIRQRTSAVTGSSFQDKSEAIQQYKPQNDHDYAVKTYRWYQKYGDLSKNQMQAAIAGLEAGEERTWLGAYEKSALRNAEDYDYELARTAGELARMEKALPEFWRLVKKEGLHEMEGLEDWEIPKMTAYRKSFGDPYQLESEIQSLKDQLESLENGKRYTLLDKESDFAQYSQYNGEGDWLQGYVNNPETADGVDTAVHIAKYTPTPILGTLARLQEKFGYQNIHRMEKEELARFNYLYNKNGEDAAKEYLDALQKTLNARSTQKLNDWVAERTKDIPVFSQVNSSLLSTPIKFLSGEGMLDVIDQKIQKKITGDETSVDYNRDGMMFANAGNAIRSSVSQQIYDKTGSNLAVGAYNLGMSMNDSAAVAIATAVHPIAGTVANALLSASTATDTMLAAAQNGASDNQAITLGLAAGFFEWFFEKYEVGSLMKQGTNVGTALVKQGFSEFVGESATELCNIAVNAYVMAENSDLEKSVQAYLQEHPEWTEEQARGQAVKDAVFQVLKAGAAGFISGNIMGGTFSTIQNVSENRNAKKIYGSDPGALVTEALELNPENAYAQKLQKKLEDGKTLTGGELRRLVQQNQQIINQQTANPNQSAVEQMPEGIKQDSNRNAGQSNVTVQTANNQTNASVNQANTVVNQEDVVKSLISKGVSSKKADSIAEVIVASLNGKEVTRSQRNLRSNALNRSAVRDTISEFMKKETDGIDSAQKRMYDEGSISDANNKEKAALWDFSNQIVAKSLPSNQSQTRAEAEDRSEVQGTLRDNRGSANDTLFTARQGLISEADILGDNKRTDEIEVEFNYISKYDATEFARQLADQQKGMNKLTVQEYLDNRQKYIAQGRAIESNAAQQAAREKAYVDKVAELQDAGLSLIDAEKQAQKWLDTQAALHNPDQVAGGHADSADGVGDKKVNSSIGSQWRYRINDVDAQVQKMAESMPESEKKSMYLNMKLTFKGD